MTILVALRRGMARTEIFGYRPPRPPRRIMSALFPLAGYEAEARRRLSPPVWDFDEGGRGDERSMRANREAFDRATLAPRLLTGTTEPDPTTVLLG